MKIVLDTNVFISGVFFSGPPYIILKAWQEGKFQIVISPEIFEEYRRVGEILAEEHPNIDLAPLLEYVIRRAEVFTAQRLPEPVASDPDDDKFIACAIASQCKVIVSGDKHLLGVNGYQNIEVFKPRDFLNKYL